MNWLTTNISDRWANHNVDFSVCIRTTQFDEVSFDQAATDVVHKISNQKIFLAFSGGYDSEYILRKLHQQKIDFVPVIVELEGLEIERAFAYKALRELKIEAKILKLSLPEFLKIYYEKIFLTINGTAWPSAQYHVCEYASAENGIFVDGGHILGDGDDLVKDQNFYLPEWDFYCHTLFPKTQICNFFLHTPQIAYSTLMAISDDYSWADYKERVFQLRYRPKIRPQYYFDQRFHKALKDIEKIRKKFPKQKAFFGQKDNLMRLIKK